MTNQSAIIFTDVPTLNDVPMCSFTNYQGESLEIKDKDDYIIDMGGFGSVATDLGLCFYNSSALQSLTLPEGFGKATQSAIYCFCYCGSLRSLVLPSGFGSVAINFTSCFRDCSALQSLTLPDGFGKAATANSFAFYGCNKLTTITGNPNFKVSVDFSSCPLTTDSAMVIINGLQTVTTTQTLTLKTSTFNALTDEQKAVATAKSWSLAYKN